MAIILNNDNQTGSGCGSRRLCIAAMVLLAVLTLAELIQAWAAWQKETGGLSHIGTVTKGSLYAVTLLSGQVYYGTLVEAKSGYLRLSDIYYAQTAPQANGHPAQFQLVNRQNVDWHGPSWMAIPTDKILMVEDVGGNSRLGSLISQDQNKTQAAH